MCLIAWNWQPGSETPLLLLSNRDEFYARAALPLHWWPDGSTLAGKDLQAGGTWLGVNRRGWLAALTNYRLPKFETADKPSRGSLVSEFLQGTTSAQDYLQTIAQEADRYNPFNLLVYDGQQFLGLESRKQRVVAIQPGIGGVSNADFNSPWPKLQRLTHGLEAGYPAESDPVQALLPLLHDMSPVDDDLLPDTGIPLEKERLLSTAFIRSDLYGTRACSVVQIRQLHVLFYEQSHTEHGMLSSVQQVFTK